MLELEFVACLTKRFRSNEFCEGLCSKYLPKQDYSKLGVDILDCNIVYVYYLPRN